jgi:hypothetical protein
LIENYEKEGIKVIAAVDVAGTKLPLTIFGRSKTPRYFSALDLPPGVWAATSQSG